MELITVNMDNLTQEEREQLIALQVKGAKKKWEPSGEWLIFGYRKNASKEYGEFQDFNHIEKYRLTGHCAKTEDQAKYISEQLTHYGWMLNAWLEVVGDWRPDWDDGDQAKYYASQYEMKSTTDYHYAYKNPHGFYFPTEKQAKQWFDMVEDRIAKLGV